MCQLVNTCSRIKFNCFFKNELKNYNINISLITIADFNI